MSALPSSPAGTPRRVSLPRFLWAARHPLNLLEATARRPGDVAQIRVGRTTLVLLKTPELVQQLLAADSAQTVKGRTLERARFFDFLGDGLLNSEGEAHRRQRRLMLPGFHRARLGGYGRSMVDTALAAATGWRDGDVRDVSADMLGLTLAVVGRTLFSSEVDGTAQTITAAFGRLSAHINHLTFPGAAWLLRLPLPFGRGLRRARSTLDEIVYALIRARRARGEDTGDLLSMLLLAEDAERPGEHLTDEEVRDQVMTLFFAGHETTANALTWIWWLLARHPTVESSLHAELAQVLGGRDPGFDDVPRLAVTEQIVREALRLYPPVWTMARRATSDLEFAGCPVVRDSLIIASQWLLHRDARWYPEPLAFQPARWTPEFRAALPRFAYFPFGGGPRSCLGENFAWTEFVLIVAALAQHWRFVPTPQSGAVAPQARITLHPDRAVRLRLHRRGPDQPSVSQL